MLLSIKAFLQQRESANLQELSLHFYKHPDTIRCFLSHWIRKGKVCRMKNPEGCGTKCRACPSQFAEIYKWVG